jgi:hypothetical protein
MKIAGTQFRPFYPQRSLNFNFSVSDYSSNNFEIGISGTDYISFKFKDGIIKDNSNNIIGTFDKEPLQIEANLRSGKYNYYLNSVPIAKDLLATNESSIFSAIVAKILDTSGEINLEAYIEGNNIPSLFFSNFYSDDVATSGTISSNAQYPIDIFSIKSNSITGTFQHGILLNPGSTLDFFNYDVKNLDPGSIVQLDMETNFSNVSYELQTRIVGDTTPPDEPEDFTVETQDNFYSRIIPYSGTITKTGGFSTGIYEIEYALPTPLSATDTNKNKLNLLFEYDAGRTGDTEIQISRTENIYYSGFLDLVNGVGSGILSNNDFSLTIEDYELDSNNKQDITFLPESVLTGYFENLYGTGNITYTLTVDDNASFKTEINDINLNSNYIIDLGGKTATFPINGNSQQREYSKLRSYKFIDLKDTLDVYTINKEIKIGDLGEAYLGREIIPFTGNVLSNEIDYNNNFIDENIFITSREFYPYRGVGFTTLPTEPTSANQSLILSGDRNGSDRPILFLDQQCNIIFFKNLPNIDFDGKYTIGTEKVEANLIKGRIILNNNTIYSKTGLYFENPTQYNSNGDQFVRRIVQDSIDSYKRLKPFDSIENAQSSLFKKIEGVETKLSPDIKWDDNNFIISKPALSSKGLSYFYSNSENLTFGIILGNRFFSDKAPYGTQISNNDGTKSNPEGTRSVTILKESYNENNLLHEVYTNGFLIGNSVKNSFSNEEEATEYLVAGNNIKFTKYTSLFTSYLFNRDYRLDFNFHREVNNAYFLSFYLKIPDGSGTVSAIANSNQLTGLGTLFTKELKVSDVIRVNGQEVTIQSITSDIVLNTTTNFNGNFSGKGYSLRGSNYLNYLLQVVEEPDINNISILSGSVVSSDNSSITCSLSDIVANQYKGHILRIIGGFGSGQDRLISSNTETKFSITPNWNINPNNTSTFEIREKINWANIKMFPSISRVYGLDTLTVENVSDPNSNIYLVKMVIPPLQNSKRFFNSKISLRLIGNGTWNRNISILTANGTGSIATITFAAQSKVIPIGSAIVVTNVGVSGYNGSFIVTGSTNSSVSYANSTSTSSTGGTLYQSDVDYTSPIYGDVNDFFADTIDRSIYIYGAQIENVTNNNNYLTNSTIIPSAYRKILVVDDSTLDANSEVIRNYYSLYGSPNNVITKSAAFTFFIYKLYNIKGKFLRKNSGSVASYLTFAPDDEEDIKNLPFEFPISTNSVKNINKYKGKLLNNNLNIFKFFDEQIGPILVNSPFLYTDFEKLYIENKNNIITFEKTHLLYSEAIIEIIDLLSTYRNFSYINYTENLNTARAKNYIMPIGGGSTIYKPIQDNVLDTIAFSGYLQKPIDLHIQAGYGRYYPYEDNNQISQLFGYFCETESFFTINNSNVINDNRSVVDTFFPGQREDIIARPSTKISSENPKLTRILKYDNSLNFTKDINSSVYLNNCFFKELRSTGVDLFATFYQAKKRIGDVWKIEIKNSIDDVNNVYTSAPSINPNLSVYNIQNIGLTKNNQINNLYVKITHNENENLNFTEEDSAKITLSVISDTQVKDSSTIFI